MTFSAVNPEQVVVAAPITGDRDADFGELFATEQRPMLRLAFLLLGSGQMAEEAVQEAFAKVYEKWDSITRPGAFLRTCVVNECRTRHRRRLMALGKRHLLAQDVAVDDRYAELADALAALPIRRRTVVVLRHYLQLNTAEIAAQLGISEGTVKSSLSRGLQQLKEHLS